MQIKTLGIEVEFGVIKGGEPVTCGFLPYTKDQPFDLDGTLYHKDASMFEVAMAPIETPQELTALYQRTKDLAMQMLPGGMHLVTIPSLEYSDEQLAADPYASVLGCSKTHNIHPTGHLPEEYEDNTRYGGLHLNIGTGEKMTVWNVMGLDFGVALYSVINWEQPFKQEIIKRRQFYGKAGEHRFKDFGLEYRTLPNFILEVTTAEEIFERVNQALSLQESDLKPHIDILDDMALAINTCDADLAREIYEEIS